MKSNFFLNSAKKTTNVFYGQFLELFKLHKTFSFSAKHPSINSHQISSHSFQLRASTAIKKGETLYATYTYTLSGTADRQQHLLEGKYFQCHCDRCLDPTELGTHFSSLKCQQCHSGFVVSSGPLGRELREFSDNNKTYFHISSSLRFESGVAMQQVLVRGRS